MKRPDQITACLIIIGNEILSGRTQDANLAIVGKKCDALGDPSYGDQGHSRR